MELVHLVSVNVCLCHTVACFCASDNWKLGAKLSHMEYTMNYVMATHNKPQVVHLETL